ncbi:MAG: glycoside hydrolase family 36 N-terminal domain-containing protein [Kiritimatiellales bacterium]
MMDADNCIFHKYFGERLAAENLLKTIPSDIKRLETFRVLSVFGGKYTGEPALKATHVDGNMTTDLRYRSHKQIQVSRNVTETYILLKDADYLFYVTPIYQAYHDEDIITNRVLIKNEEGATVTLENFSSFDLTAKNSEFWLTRFYGNRSAEMQMEKEKMDKGIHIIDSKKGDGDEAKAAEYPADNE